MKKLKIISAICLSAFLAAAMMKFALLAEEPEELTSDGYTYTINSDGTATVTRYKGAGGNIEIPSRSGGVKVTAIGNSAFKDCDTIVSVKIPDSVASIGNYAFYGCTALASAAIPDSVEIIGYFAFGGCTALKSAVIPDSVKEIRDCTFQGCSGLTSVTIGNGVKKIGDSAFQDCVSLASVTIPDKVTVIKGCAFARCGIISVNIGKSVEDIGNSAFRECAGLISVDIPDGVANIAGFAFAGCGKLISINVDKKNKAYTDENGVLFNKDKTLLLQYPAGKQGGYDIPGGVTDIAPGAFYGCFGLTSADIPGSVADIGAYAFSGCTKLTSAVIPEGVIKIDDGVFYNCSGLISISIPGSVTDINGNAFYGCASLTAIDVDADNTVYASESGVAFDKSKKTLIKYPAGKKGGYDIPGGVENIGYAAFRDCIWLTSVNIPDSVEDIGAYAFQNCTELTSVIMPVSVTGIGICAFYNCYNLTIYGRATSYAETYAKENDIPFAVIDAYVEPAPGDVNGDGSVNVIDARWALQASSGNREFTEQDKKVADVNGDGEVNIIDARWLMQVASGSRTLNMYSIPYVAAGICLFFTHMSS